MNKYLKWVLIGSCISICFISVYLAGNSQPSVEHENISVSRIVSINPAATEILFELGCQDKLIAVSDFCNYPPEIENIDKVGGVINPNFEHISVLNPDLIIIQGKCDNIVDYCRHKEIEYININLRNISEIYHGINDLGEILQCQETANTLCRKIQKELEAVKDQLDSANKKKVFFSLYRMPGTLTNITTCGPDTFLNEIITIAGGHNIFSDLKQDYPVVSKETLLKRQPEIIIETYSHSTGQDSDFADVFECWPVLDKLDAVQNGNIHMVDSDLVLRPGPRVGQAALELARIIHPELFYE